MLGEFEYLLITASARLAEEAYGAAIRQQIEHATGRVCSIGALYTTLDRLEAKGYLKTWMGDPTQFAAISPNQARVAVRLFAAFSIWSRGGRQLCGRTGDPGFC
jgi:DNA-binding PadR family transcriptional regulator